MRRTIALVIAGLVVLAAAVAVLIVRVTGDGEPSATAGTPTAAATEMTPFEATGAGVSLSYPADWDRLETPDPQVLLIATPNGRDSLLVRTTPLNMTVTDDDLEGVREFTRELVTDGTGVEIITGPRQIEVAGLPGWYYLYRFDDARSGEVGAHAHYFLFDGDRMIALVFQALPDDRFESLAPIFDQIVNSLTVDGTA